MITPEHSISPPQSASNESRVAVSSQPLLNMFTGVPKHYDFLNRALTWGFDERWRKLAALECLRDKPEKVLDLCCGTGDLTLHLARMAMDNTQIVGLDFCKPMLEMARAKAVAQKPGEQVTFVHGDAACLPFPNGHFPAAGISFAFRNITYRNPLRQQYLAEIRRVIAPGGKFVIVETSQPVSRIFRKFFHLYLKAIVPGVGGFVSGHKGAYNYLAESASRFYPADEVSTMLLECGFQRVEYRLLSGGIAAIHIAIR